MSFEFNFRGVSILVLVSAVLVLVLLMATSGCVTMAKTQYREMTKTPVPTAVPDILKPTIAPIRTIPTTEPPYPARYINPYMHGERWEGQWFRWIRINVQGINGQGTKDLDVGIIAYRHNFYDKLTWYNGALGQYIEMKPEYGYRYFVVWVHEEMFGTNTTMDPSMWIFDQSAFRLQVKDKIYSQDVNYNPVNILKEFEGKYDYYNTVITPPFGYYRDYTGHSPETAGWEVFQKGYLRMGKGNACDGYMIFQIPKDSQPEDIALLGNFATFGSAYWKFIV